MSEAGKTSVLITTHMRKLEKVFLETVILLTGHDEKKASQVTSESFFGMVQTFVDKIIKALPKPREKDKEKNKTDARRERKFGLGQKVVRREIMKGIKVGVKLKKTSGPQKVKQANSGSALAQIMSKTMVQRRKMIDSTVNFDPMNQLKFDFHDSSIQNTNIDFCTFFVDLLSCISNRLK